MARCVGRCAQIVQPVCSGDRHPRSAHRAEDEQSVRPASRGSPATWFTSYSTWFRAFRHVERKNRPDVPSQDVRPAEASADEVSATDELSHTGRHLQSCR
ncbi:hypothetical protein B1964_26805 [Gordonia sp. i37]|nr:hypothetical protein B1964_26805 [Gordonia sp. i37]